MTESPESNTSFILREWQRAIHKALALKNPELGHRYLGTLHALRNTGNPDRVAQAAHSARELIDILPGAFSKLLVSPPGSRRTDILIEGGEKFVRLYRQNATHSDYSKLAENLITRLEAGKDRKTELMNELIGADLSDRKHISDLERLAKGLNEIRNRFARIAHHDKLVADDEVLQLVEKLETILSAISLPYFETESELERLLVLTNPTSADYDRLKNILAKSALIERFYRYCTNPQWFPFLRDDGRFTDATPIDRKGDLVGCPEWPHAVYLTKCVNSFPDDVLRIVTNVTTDNPRVHSQLVDVALLLPPVIGKSLVEKAREWLDSPYLGITPLPERLAKLAVALLAGGEIEKGFELARILLDVTIDELRNDPSDELSFIDTKPEARTRINDWQYEQALDLILPTVTAADPGRTIRTLCELLSTCISLESSVRDQSDDHDFSYIWRPAIEEHEQNHSPHDVKHLLLVALRDACLDFVRCGSIEAEKAYELLRPFSYPMFRRLELFLLANVPEFAPKLLDAAVANPEQYYGFPTHHEYFVLLHRRFNEAGGVAQKRHLEWIDQGPNMESFHENFVQWAGTPPTDADLNQYRDTWVRDKLAAIVNHLPGDRIDQYERLVASVGPPEHPGFLAYSRSWSGPMSPVGVSDLSSLSPQEVFDYLQTWTPTGGLMSPSPDGLGRVLASTVQARATEFSDALTPRLAEALRPTYLFWLFHGLEQSLKDRPALPWNSILSLAKSVATLTTSPITEPPGDDSRTSWESVQKAVASLIVAGLEHESLIPYQNRETVWLIIEPLTRAPQPSLEYEKQYGGTNADPVTMSINTTRGEAAHALFRYMCWVDLEINEGKRSDEQQHSIPEECLPVLDRFLDPLLEPTLTIRSVLGRYLVPLCALDLEWVKSHFAAIVPEIASQIHLKHAAFEGYFSLNRASRFLFKNLPELFHLAFKWAMMPEEESSHLQPRRRFVEHIIENYWHGDQELSDPQSLIARVYSEAPANLRAFATEFVGRSLEVFFPKLPGHSEVLLRIQEFWDWRIQAIKTFDPKDHQDELKSFGWWIANARIEAKWILDRGVEALSMTDGVLDYAHAVVKRVPELVCADSVQTARMLDYLVRGDKEGWGVAFWEADTTAAFAAIKQTANAEAWMISVQTINFLGERGHRQYGTLLD